MSEPESYSEFHAMSRYQKGRLVTTNFWRVLNGQVEIPVPPEYTGYPEKWKAAKEKAEAILQERKDKFGI